MKNHVLIFKVYHIAIILMFFLPFMPIECSGPGFGPSAEQLAEMARLDSLKQDSILKAQNDSIFKDSISKLSNTNKISNNLSEFQKDSVNCSDSTEVSQNNLNAEVEDSIVATDTVAYKNNTKNKESKFHHYFFKILEFICTDGNNNYTGFGIIFSYFEYYFGIGGVINAFILLLVSSIMVFRKKWRFFKSILLIDSLGLIFLALSDADLWGYWVCLISWIGLVIFDIVILRVNLRLFSDRKG